MIRRLFLCSLFFLICSTLSAQSIEKRYRSYLTSTGMLHFIGKKKLTKVEALSNFEYDITYIAGEDSATVNFSFVTDTPTSVKQSSLDNGHNTEMLCNPKMMFRDVIKRGYKIRTTTKVPFEVLRKFYEDSTPFSFMLELANEIKCSATFTTSQWKKESHDVQRVFCSITTN